MSKESWQDWFVNQAMESRMKTRKTSLSKLDKWGFQEDGTYGRDDGGFFRILGIRVSVDDDAREVATWDQPLLEEKGEGFIVFAKAKGEDLFLIRAKLEPGAPSRYGYVSLNTPLAASKSNLEAVHGGKKPPRAEFKDGAKTCPVLIDPGKFAGKVNHCGFVEIDDPNFLELRDDERWFTRDELREAIQAGVVSSHLLEALAVYLI